MSLNDFILMLNCFYNFTDVRHTKAITSRQRTSERTIKRAALIKGKSDHKDYKCRQCELDTQADTICDGEKFRPIALTGMTCKVHGFHESFETVPNVPVAQVAIAFVHPTMHETFILIINEALYFGSTKNHSLINPNQIRLYSISVSDDPYDKSRPFGIDHEYIYIPFQTKGSTVYFDSFVPSDNDLERCRHIMLTDNKEWSPHDVVMGGDRPYGDEIRISEMNKSNGDHFDYETDSVLGGISPVFNQHLFADRLIVSVQICSKTGFLAP